MNKWKSIPKKEENTTLKIKNAIKKLQQKVKNCLFLITTQDKGGKFAVVKRDKNNGDSYMEQINKALEKNNRKFINLRGNKASRLSIAIEHIDKLLQKHDSIKS